MLHHMGRLGLAAMVVAVLGISGNAWAAITVTSVSPNMGDIGGGETVEIVGTGFLTATGVSFGGTAASSFTIVSDTLISATTDAHAKGCVAVVVTDGVTPVSLDDGFAYTSFNRVLQVSVRVKIGESSRIHWGAGTSSDDTLTAIGGGAAHVGNVADIDSYVWFVRDCDFGVPPAEAQVNLSTTYDTDGSDAIFATVDTDNAKTLNVENDSTTSSAIDISAIVSNSVPDAGVVFWAPTGPGPDTFRMSANIAGAGGTGVQALGLAATLLVNEMAVGAQSLTLELRTPTSTTAALTVNHTITVSLIASVD